MKQKRRERTNIEPQFYDNKNTPYFISVSIINILYIFYVMKEGKGTEWGMSRTASGALGHGKDP